MSQNFEKVRRKKMKLFYISLDDGKVVIFFYFLFICVVKCFGACKRSRRRRNWMCFIFFEITKERELISVFACNNATCGERTRIRRHLYELLIQLLDTPLSSKNRNFSNTLHYCIYFLASYFESVCGTAHRVISSY